MCTIIQKYANTGLAYISTANSNLNGTGTLATVLTVGSVSGTKVNSVTIKATSNTSQGMVRLFTYDGTNYVLWQEVMVAENTQSATVAAFQTTIYDELILEPGQSLLAATQNAEPFNVFAAATDWINCDCTSDCTCGDDQAVADTGVVNIDTANPNLDGSGTVYTVLTAPTGSLANGTKIFSIDVKAIQSTDQGMIRLFLYDGSANYLIWEIPIPGTTQSNLQPAYRTTCVAAINLQPGYSLCASTQNANSFNIITFASDITNCPCPQSN